MILQTQEILSMASEVRPDDNNIYGFIVTVLVAAVIFLIGWMTRSLKQKDEMYIKQIDTYRDKNEQLQTRNDSLVDKMSEMSENNIVLYKDYSAILDKLLIKVEASITQSKEVDTIINRDIMSYLREIKGSVERLINMSNNG